jgi:hypothetical protein
LTAAQKVQLRPIFNLKAKLFSANEGDGLKQRGLWRVI